MKDGTNIKTAPTSLKPREQAKVSTKLNATNSLCGLAFCLRFGYSIPLASDYSTMNYKHTTIQGHASAAGYS